MKTYNLKFENLKHLDEFISSKQDLLTSKNILIQVFSGVIDKTKLEEICSRVLKKLPDANIIGATTDGEIIEGEVTTNEIIIAFSIFEKTTIKIACLEYDDSYECGINITKDLLEDNSKVFIMFGAGLSCNAEDFLDAVHTKAPNVIVAGGLAGDNGKFEKTFVICNNRVLENAVVGVSLNSDALKVQNKNALAWKKLGRKLIVNKSEGNRVYEIDGMTPYELYKKYLGTEVSDHLYSVGIEFPLIIQKEDQEIARVFMKAHTDGSMTFGGNIPENSVVRFGIGNIDEFLADSYNLYSNLIDINSESIFIYSCMARRRYLEDKVHLDTEHFKKITSTSGFFTYGEFFTSKTRNELFNQSLTVLSLNEGKEGNKRVNLIENENPIRVSLRERALSNIILKTTNDLDNLATQLEKDVIAKIKENKRQEVYIFEQDKLARLGEMIANIAHQWRQPLSAISSGASAVMIQDEYGMLSKEELHDTMTRIVSSTKFLSETINTFRDFIKDDRKEKEVVVQEHIDIVLEIIETTLKNNNIEVINKMNYDNPITKTFVVGELSQVILNILNNAKDALLENKIEKPSIIIDCYCVDDTVTISIEDNGGGIPSEVLPRIFDPYYTTKCKNNGTGLGLYMSKSIIEEHFNGKLYAKNSDTGVKFFIEFPFSS